MPSITHGPKKAAVKTRPTLRQKQMAEFMRERKALESLANNGLTNPVEFIDFNIDFASDTKEGRLNWNPEDGVPEVGLPGGRVNQQIGMELYLPRRVRNVTGSGMANGNIVYISGGTGVNLNVSLAKADAAGTAKPVIAMLTEDIANNSQGFATTFGLVRGTTEQPINTSSFSVGDELWLSPTVAGGWTNIMPNHPFYVVSIGHVFRSHATEGSIVVHIKKVMCAECIAGGGSAVWEDLKFPASSSRQGVLSKPDYDYTNNGLLFPQNNTAEKIHIIAQMPHTWLLESDLYPHVHFVQDSATTPTFKMDYRWYKNGGDPTGAWTTITFNNFVFTYTSGSLMQVATPASPIDGTGMDTISSFLDIVVYRDDNVYPGDALYKEFDIHYLIDSIGSRSFSAKG